MNAITTNNHATTMTYNAAGSLLTSTDPAQHTSTLSYVDSFSSDGTNALTPHDSSGNTITTFAYPTMMTDADGFSSSVKYNYDFGAKTRVQGPPPQGQQNGIIQTFSYDDATRLKQATTVNTGAYVHYDYGPDYTSTFASVNSVAANYWQSDSYTNQFFDGLGRVFAAASNHPGSTGGNKGQYTRYDQMGRAVQQTNPFEMDSGWNPAGDDAAGYQFNVANTFDWKGRPLKSYNMDGTYKEASYAGCGCAGGEVATLTDEVERKQKIYSDILGRQWKTEVLNDNGSVYSTTETLLNARDQAYAVRQFQGLDTSSVYTEATTTYDGYGRVLTSKLPQQTVATSYEYNLDDTVHKVTDPRGVVATNTFNARHLLTGVSYDPGSSGVPALAAISFEYDAAGNKTLITDGTGSTTFGYDELSRITSESHYLNDLGNSYALSYGYNLAGELTSITDPSNAQVSYNYDSTGRLTSMPASGYTGVTNFFSNPQYRAFGALKHGTYGNSVQLNLTYNSRMQIGQYQVGSSNFTAGATMDYYADGRTNTAFDLSDSRFDRKYEFDFSARLKEAYSGVEAHGAAAPPINQANSPYRQSYTYDAWNNATLRQGRIWSTQSEYDAASYGSDNKRGGFGYDWAGNITSDSDGTRSYDAAGRPATFTSSQNWQVYPNWPSWGGGDGPGLETSDTFDGAGQVVKHIDHTRHDDTYESGAGTLYQMTNTTRTTYYIYSAVLGGKTIEELNQSGTKTKGYVYSGGARIATQVVSGGTNSVELESTNPVTGAVTTTDANGTYAGRQEPDPLSRDLTNPPDPNIVLDPMGVSSKFNSPMYIEYTGGPSQDAIDGLAAWGAQMEVQRWQYQHGYFDKGGYFDIKNQFITAVVNQQFDQAAQILTKNPNFTIELNGKMTAGQDAADSFMMALANLPGDPLGMNSGSASEQRFNHAQPQNPIRGVTGGANGSAKCATPNNLVHYFQKSFEALWDKTTKSGEENGELVFWDRATNTYPEVKLSEGRHIREGTTEYAPNLPAMPDVGPETTKAFADFAAAGRNVVFMAFIHTHPNFASGASQSGEPSGDDIQYQSDYGNVLGIIRAGNGYSFFLNGRKFGPDDPKADQCIGASNH